MKSLPFSLLLSAVSLLATAQSPMLVPPEKLGTCTQEMFEGDLWDFSCPLESPQAGARYRFEAHFSGVHDDSMAKMTPMVSGTEVACADSGKVRFNGDEMGDHSLECHFTLPAAAGAKAVFRMRMRWSHADLAAVELVRE